MLEAEAGDQFGRRLGGHRRRGQQQKACGHSCQLRDVSSSPKCPLFAKPARFSIGNVDASRQGPSVLFLALDGLGARTGLMSADGGKAELVLSPTDVAF